MGLPRDYRKPRQKELVELLSQLPYPLRIEDRSGRPLWRNAAAERVGEAGGEWAEHRSEVVWQGQQAWLCRPQESAPEELLRDDAPERELAQENERLRRHQRQTARKKKQAEEKARQNDRAIQESLHREQRLRQQLAEAEQRLREWEEGRPREPAEPPSGRRRRGRSGSIDPEGAAPAESWQKRLEQEQERAAEALRSLAQSQAEQRSLQSEYEAYRQRVEEAETQRRLEEQLAVKVRELEELERSFEQEQQAFLNQKRELQQRLSEQEEEFRHLRDTVHGAVTVEASRWSELHDDLNEAKLALAESTRRESRLADQLEAAERLQREQSQALVAARDELEKARAKELEWKETVQLTVELRDQARAEARRFQAEAEEARAQSQRWEAKVLQSRSLVAEASAPTLALEGALPALKNQLELAQNRLRETERQLDEARGALKKAQSEALASRDTEKLAFQDSLTGLPNRHIVDRYLDFSHQQARQTSRAYLLFLIDLDGFRVLNQTFGRDWGDALLKSVGERLASMRTGNQLFARHSEDRFLLLAADLLRPAVEPFVAEACRSLLGALAHPFEVKGESIRLTGSLGVAVGPPASDNPRDLFAQAEMALESAKAQGIGSSVVHHEALAQKAQRQAVYGRQMGQAIERREFAAVYQPVFDLHKGLVSGVELLLRWHHRDQRVLRPEDFLEVAERTGQIVAITESVWPQAFRALARWRKLRPGVTLSINLGDRELLSPGLVERATRLVREAQIEPSSVLFEVRDGSRLRHSGVWWSILETLAGAGFGLVLDDYGSDASLFGTLAYAGFSQAKVQVEERQVVCPQSPQAARGVLLCAKRIQTRFDPKALRKAGFDLAQGFAVGRPIEEREVDTVLGR